MGSMRRRLVRLEAHAEEARVDARAAVSREVLRRMSDVELRAYVAALRRARQVGEFTDGEDRPILGRIEELYGEVGSSERHAPTS